MDSVGGVFVVLIGETEDAGDGDGDAGNGDGVGGVFVAGDRFLADDMLVVIVDDCNGDWELQF